MAKRTIGIAILISGCAVVHPTTQRGMLVITPQFIQGTYATRATLLPYTQSSIQHLVLKLYDVTSGDQDLGISRDLLNAQMDNPVVFSNLRSGAKYRIRAYAYKASGTNSADLISTNDSNSYVDMIVGNDDRPTLSALKVRLIDRLFDGQGTSSVVVGGGGYSPIASEGMVFPLYGITKTIVGIGNVNGYQDGNGTNARFQRPWQIAVNNGTIYLPDRENTRFRKVDPAGNVSFIAGGTSSGYVDGTGSAAKFTDPTSVAINPRTGDLYVVACGDHCVRKITSAGVVTTFAGNGTSANVDGTGLSARFVTPYSIAIDQQENLYVADIAANTIRKINPAGVVTTFAGNGATAYADGIGTAAQFNVPAGVTVDASGNVYVSEWEGERIRKITPTGAVSTLAGSGSWGFADGTGSAAQFFHPCGLAVDTFGNLYVADYQNLRIRKITPQGVVTTLLGSTNGYIDGTGTAALFAGPAGVAIDSDGAMYLSDGYAIRRVY